MGRLQPAVVRPRSSVRSKIRTPQLKIRIMKILVFTSLFPNNVWPNNNVFVKERMSHVARIDGCQVKVVAPVPYFPKINWGWRAAYLKIKARENIEGLEVLHPRYLMTPKIGMTLYGLMMFVSMIRTVAKIRKEFEFDLIDAHYIYPDGFAAILLGRWFRKPVIVSARGSDVNRYAEISFIRPLLRYTMAKADGVIAVSAALKQVIARLGIPEEKVSVIPNGVDPKKFHPIPRERAREFLGLPSKKKLILATGRLVPVKDFGLLIRAFKILVDSAQELDVGLIIVGDGKERERLENLIAELGLGDHVRLVGTVPHDQLNVWYSAADLFCLCSRREGWPNVLLESMACGTPVVATPVGGIPEIVRCDAVGILTRRTPAELAKSLREGLNRNWRREDVVTFARELTWERTAQAVVRLFELHVSLERTRGDLNALTGASSRS